MTKWNPLSKDFNRRWYSLKQGWGWCKYVQSLLHKGVIHLIQNHALMQTQTHYFEVEPAGVCSTF